MWLQYIVRLHTVYHSVGIRALMINYDTGIGDLLVGCVDAVVMVVVAAIEIKSIYRMLAKT